MKNLLLISLNYREIANIGVNDTLKQIQVNGIFTKLTIYNDIIIYKSVIGTYSYLNLIDSTHRNYVLVTVR